MNSQHDRLLRSLDVWRDEWRWSNFGPREPGKLSADAMLPPSEEETNMFKVLNNLRVDPGDEPAVSQLPISDLSFDAPGHYPEQNRYLALGKFTATHAKRWPKDAPKPGPQPIEVVKVKKKSPSPLVFDSGDAPPPVIPVAPSPAIVTTPLANPDQDVSVSSAIPPKKRQVDFIESEPKHQKVTPTPKPVEEAPKEEEKKKATPPPSLKDKLPSPPPSPPFEMDDLPPEDDSEEVPALPPPPEVRRPTPAAPTRAELLAGTGIDEAEYDSAEEPSDAEDLANTDGEEEDDEAEPEGPPRPLPPVHLSYEQRNAAEMAAVQRDAPAAAAKAKGKGKGKQPKILKIGATPENTPIAAGTTPSFTTKKAKAEKLDKELMGKMLTLQSAEARLSPAKLIRRPQDLESADQGPNAEFVQLWNYAVDLALDAEFKRPTGGQTKAREYGERYDVKWLEQAKKVVYSREPPASANAAKIRNMHRLFWCYEQFEIILPEAPVATSECWIVFKKPRENQAMCTQPEVRVSFRYHRYEGMLYVYKALHPWIFLQGRAILMVKRIRQGQSVSAEKVEERLKSWETNGVIRLIEWRNATIMAGWNFFT